MAVQLREIRGSFGRDGKNLIVRLGAQNMFNQRSFISLLAVLFSIQAASPSGLLAADCQKVHDNLTPGLSGRPSGFRDAQIFAVVSLLSMAILAAISYGLEDDYDSGPKTSLPSFPGFEPGSNDIGPFYQLDRPFYLSHSKPSQSVHVFEIKGAQHSYGFIKIHKNGDTEILSPHGDQIARGRFTKNKTFEILDPLGNIIFKIENTLHKDGVEILTPIGKKLWLAKNIGTDHILVTSNDDPIIENAASITKTDDHLWTINFESWEDIDPRPLFMLMGYRQFSK